jgi:polyisoprenoid-binding protein YceI
MIRPQSIAFMTCLVLGLSAHAGATTFDRVDTAKSSIKFVPTLMGSKTEGRFSKFTAQVRFDPDKPATASAKAQVDIRSFDIGYDEATDEALGKNWFDVQQFPTADFTVTKVQPLAKDRFELTGNLTIRGKTKAITFPVTLTRESASAARLDGTVIIKRLDFNLGQGAWAATSTVSNDVTLMIRLALVGQ